MESFAALINELGGPAAISEFTGWKTGTIQQMKARNNVLPYCWPKLIEMAGQKGLVGVDRALMADLAVKASTAKVKRPATHPREAA